jgi:hypothetical protein
LNRESERIPRRLRRGKRANHKKASGRYAMGKVFWDKGAQKKSARRRVHRCHQQITQNQIVRHHPAYRQDTESVIF